MSPEAPVVFICHANEDADAALEVAAGLRAAGIGAWLDKDSLRGGADWNDTVERLLKEDVQYVAVLQSSAMFHKDVGYVNKEINIALDRQSFHRPPRVFLIPVVIDDPVNRLDMLSHLQSVNVAPPAGVTELVKTIRRDHGRQGPRSGMSTITSPPTGERFEGAPAPGSATPGAPTSGSPAGERSYRYPGSPPFRDIEIDRRLFKGRDEEAKKVFHSILSADLFLLYAVSGMGKSSLLNAGVMHRLREPAATGPSTSA